MLNSEEWPALLGTLRELPHETEWVEFKENCDDPEAIGERLSALSNSARLLRQSQGYFVWGVQDKTHALVGTDFRPRRQKVKGQQLESFLTLNLRPRLHLEICEFEVEGKDVVIFKVPPAWHTPVRWHETEWVRVGSYTQKLRDYPEKERALWLQLDRVSFEQDIALRDVPTQEVTQLLDYPAYFALSGQPLPDGRAAILERLSREKLIVKRPHARYDITNLGAIAFARDLTQFAALQRKTARVISYRGFNRVDTIKERVGPEAVRGYGAGFESLIAYINNELPRNEHLGEALRREFKAYPEVAIRELVANALIHQDFFRTGEGPTIEIFDDRIEITNGGRPLIDTLRFLDEPPQSRNEELASLMRRLNICEERGSGVDKTVSSCEFYQLPAPDFRATTNHTVATLFAPQKLSTMDSKDKIRACYQHACLRYVSNDQMTNSSLRQRLGIAEGNYPIASRIIAETISEGLVKPYDPTSTSKKNARYVPFWA